MCDTRQMLRKRALQQAVAWGKQHNAALSGDACFHIGALIHAAQHTIRQEFGEEAYRETLTLPWATIPVEVAEQDIAKR